MMEFLIYDLKVAALIAVFYMFYRLLLSRETFHHVNRVVLLTTAAASFVLPLCVITLHKTVVLPFSASHGAVSLDGMQAVVEQETPLWQTFAVALFLAGVAITLGYTLFSIIRVLLLIHKSEKHPQPDGITICVTQQEVSPFSWMHYIVLSRNDYSPLPSEGEALILAHERGHIRLRHSWDVVFADTLTALQWFNPAMWMLRQDLRAIHEYEADAAVLSMGINARQYQYLLITKAASIGGYSIANGINHSTLKNRINMMLHKQSNRTGLLKLLALVPIVGVALALNAETITHYVYNEPQKKIVKKGRQDGQVKIGNQTIEVKAEQTAAKDKETTINDDATITYKLKDGEKDPLIVIDGKVASVEQMKALDPKTIDNVNVVKNEEVKKHYAAHFKADTSNGIIFINTKDYVKKGGSKEVVSVVVNAKNPQQETTEDAEMPKVFDVVENMPEFPGGMTAMMQFLAENVCYPEAAEKAGTQGRVIATFIVEKDGSITNIKIVKSVSEELDAEAKRVIEAMPNWKPGKQSGEPVRVKYTIPITFRLS